MHELIHNSVATLRSTHEVTQEELANAVAVSRQTISALEKGNYTPSILLALRIAQFFNSQWKQFLPLPMKNNSIETLVTIALIVIAILLLNPFHFWMPNMMVVGMLASALVLFGFFASFILREQSVDERDVAHETLAGRNAFLAGSATLMLGIIIEGYLHTVDPVLVIALIIMITTKIATRIWSDKHR